MSSNSEPDAVQTTTYEDGITVITINCPHRRNAVDSATAQKLYDQVLEFEDDPKHKVLILNGANGTFCAGFDLHTVAQSTSSEGQNAAETNPVQSGRSRGPMGPSRLQIKKPVISAVSGYAVAGGLELSLLGDMRIAEEDAIFGVFCRRWGVPLIDGGTVRLQAMVGLGRALDMILTGRPVDAKEALQMGLANRIVRKGQALEAAMEMAKELVKFPELCLNVDRTSCYNAAYNASSLEDALAFEYKHGAEILQKESVKGAARFSSGEGRHGSFKGFGSSKL